MNAQDDFRRDANAELAREGMRLAKPGESGWYVVICIDGDAVKVWATDEPETDDDCAHETPDNYRVVHGIMVCCACGEELGFE